MIKTNIMIEFCILGDDFNPKEITQKLLIEPTEYYKRGEKSIRNIEKKKHVRV